MHRAKSVEVFKGFTPSDEKSFDRNPHLKTLRDELDIYESNNIKSLDEYEGVALKSENPSEWITGKMDSNQRSHKRAINKIARAMCKAAFGEEDEPDEKTVEIIKEFLAPHVDAQLLIPLTAKIASKLTGENTKKLGEAHQHLKAATAVLESLSKALGDGSGEIEPAVVEAPAIQRSAPAKVAPVKDEGLDAHIFAREILRGITTAATDGLKDINQVIRNGRSTK
jgi:hypothetical protein